MARARILGTESVRIVTAIAAALVVFALASWPVQAHKPITSPFTYNDDVFPILRDRCGRCHVAGGVAPMSLMTYKDAFPWGESIRTELVAGHMPPGGVIGAAGRFRNVRPLSARDLNVLMTWVTGGNPMGNADHTPPAVSPSSDWPLGTPDLVLAMPRAFTIASDKVEETTELAWPLPPGEARRLRAVDLRPGNAAIVRSATISVTTSSAVTRTAPALERILALWVPGEDPVTLDAAAFDIPSDAELVLRLHYKKTWEHERLAMTDRSSVGLYFAPTTASEIRALTLTPQASDIISNRQITFSVEVDQDLQAVALYPDAAVADVDVTVHATRQDGIREELIRLRPQAGWARRYWFASPVALPRGTRVTVTAAYNEALLPPGAAPVAATPPNPSTLRLTLNVLRQ